METFDGRDWIVDPVGRAIVLAGIDWCRHWGMHCEALGYAPYGKFVSEHYPSADAWAEQTSRRLSEWGFSFLAVGPSPPMRYRALAHANGSDSVYFSTHLCQGDDPDRWISPYRHAPGTAFPNVFHPDFEKTCDELARKRCAEHVDDPWLVGYFIDNELRWWGLGDTATGLFELVRTLPPEHSARKALDAFVAEHCGALGDRALPVDGGALGDRALPVGADLRAARTGGSGAEPPLSVKRTFVALVAETYFSTLASAIRKADPNHLLLGCRFAGLDYAPEILSACGRHCDVVSVNVYPWADLDTGIVLDRRGDVPLPVRYLFLRPFATEAEPQGVRGDTVPNLWKGPVEGWWRLSDGAMFGFASIDPGVVSAYLWYRDEDATQHPDVRCAADQPFTLAPGASYEPPVPMGARLRYLPRQDGGL